MKEKKRKMQNEDEKFSHKPHPSPPVLGAGGILIWGRKKKSQNFEKQRLGCGRRTKILKTAFEGVEKKEPKFESKHAMPV